METTGAMRVSVSRSSFTDILEDLDPLPELPDTGEDRFFTKEALEYNWPTAVADNPPFPTWGTTGVEMAAIGAAAAAAAGASASATTAPPPSPNASLTPVSGTKRPLPEDSQQEQQQQRRNSAAPDRTVFLRQRLGGESLSSGNSSTSTCSDTASDGVAGEWDVVSGGPAAGIPPKPLTLGPPGLPRGSKASSTSGEVPPTSPATRIGSMKREESSRATSRGGRRKRRRSSKTKAVEMKPRKRGSSRAISLVCNGGGYASWDALVKPFKQQWDQIEPPHEGQVTHDWNRSPPSSPGSACSRFSTDPEPDDSTAFSIEQCSAFAHPTAVASYVLRVRCAGGAHIVRRTWDDIVCLCTMLGAATTPALSAGGEGATGEGPRAAPSATTTASPTTGGLDFAPADVLGSDAASGFLKELLARPHVAWRIPARRFLELEYLDGTMRGGFTDDSREKTARQVASVAASAATAAVKMPGAMATDKQHQQQHLQRGTNADGGHNGMNVSTPAPSAVFLTVGAPRVAAALSRTSLGLPAHPDAARDLAAVCRSLGELGAAAFIPLPRADATAPYWGSRDTSGAPANVGNVAPQRGMPVLA